VLHVPAAQLGLALGGDHDARRLVVDHDIDDSTCRPIDRGLDHPGPSRVQDANEGLGDPGLNRIPQSGTGARVEAEIQISTERGRYGDQHGQARFSVATFDARQEGMVESGELAQPSL